MLHYEIPTQQRENIFNDLMLCKKNNNISNNNYSFQKFLLQAKKDIEQNNKSWDIFKKYTNPYEYVHTTINNIKLSKYRPLSRAFYKMIEIVDFFNLLWNSSNKSIHTFHIAEGPGGFIEAMNFYRKKTTTEDFYCKDTYRGLTLIDDGNNNIPGWNKAKYFLRENPNVIIEYGPSKDGNLYKLSNLMYIYKEHRNKYDIVTGDGGFDFSNDFNNQEATALKLVLCEILYGIIITKKGGDFIVKLFDLFTSCSYDIIYIVSCLFNEVYICKPNTSRYGNSEKYLICKSKKIDIDDDMFNKIKKIFIEIQLYGGDFNDISILKNNIPLRIVNIINEMNSIFVERQLQNINETISLIVNNKKIDLIESYKIKHVKICIEWLKKFGIPFNDYKKQNLFISN